MSFRASGGEAEQPGVFHFIRAFGFSKTAPAWRRSSTDQSPDWALPRAWSLILELSDKRVNALLGIAQEHARVWGGEKRIIYSGETGFERTLQHNTHPRLVHIDDRHSVKGCPFFSRCGVDHVVRTDHHSHIHGRNRRVNILGLDQLFIRDLGFRKQYIHMPRHAAGHRVHAVPDFAAVGFQQVAQFAHGMLRLGNGHSVSRHKDDG